VYDKDLKKRKKEPWDFLFWAPFFWTLNQLWAYEGNRGKAAPGYSS